MSKYEITGAIRQISDTQTFASGFCKREFVIETNSGKFPQMIKMECVKDRTHDLDNLNVNDVVNVSFDIRGSEYKDRFYVNLVAWKVQATGETSEGPRDVPASEAVRKMHGSEPASQHQQAKQNAYVAQDADSDDCIPF